MMGNAWEWVNDWWTPAHYLTEENQAIGFVDPPGPSIEELEQLQEMGYLQVCTRTALCTTICFHIIRNL